METFLVRSSFFLASGIDYLSLIWLYLYCCWLAALVIFPTFLPLNSYLRLSIRSTHTWRHVPFMFCLIFAATLIGSIKLMKKLDTFEFFVVHALGNLSILLKFENKLEIATLTLILCSGGSRIFLRGRKFPKSLADLRGAPRTPPRSNSFIFMQFSAKNLQNSPNLGIGAPTSGKYWIRHWKWYYFAICCRKLHKNFKKGATYRQSATVLHWKLWQ